MTGQNFAVNVHLLVVVKEPERSDFKLLVIPLGIKVVFHAGILRTSGNVKRILFLWYNAFPQKHDVMMNYMVQVHPFITS